MFNLRKQLYKEVFIKGMAAPIGIGFFILAAVGTSYLVLIENYLPVLGVIGGLAGSMIVYIVIFKPLTGFYIITLMGCFAFYPSHIFHIQLGISTIVEVLYWLSLIGCLMYRPTSKLPDNIWRSPITVMFIIYFAYHVVQYFNPELRVRTMYFFIMRKFLMFFWIYYISYQLMNSPAKIKFFLKFWILMGFLAGAYGCYQQWFGYLPQELEFIMRDPVNYGLIFQGGQFRKFSFLSDVVQFGVFSGALGLLTLIIAIHEKRKPVKFFLFFAAIIMILGMSYSGTRTATFILPAGISLYIVMTIRNKTTLVTIFGSLMVVLFILFAPIYNNKTLNRLRTSFETKDASLNVRDVNRHYIQPYMYKHPFGGGVGTSGVGGYETDPTHFLATFPPDSGLLQIGIEVGWIGLILTCIWYLVILYYYIYTASRIRDPEFKIYTTALTCCLLSIMVTQYSQQSIGQIPMVIFYMSSLSIVMRLLEFEKLALYK